jgi:hypothetical protein
MKRDDSLKGLISFEGMLFWLDLSGLKTGDGIVADVFEPDGTRRKATTRDVDLFELMQYGHMLSQELPGPEELKRMAQEIAEK